MIDIFGEAGRISSMKHVFHHMQEKGIRIDYVTYTSMMQWLSSSGNMDEAIALWDEMKSKGSYPTVVSYTVFIKILFDNHRVKEATSVYEVMIQSDCVPNYYTYTVLMDHLIGSGKRKEALEIFERMQGVGVELDKVACNILIKKCSKVGGIEFMTHILRYMKENHFVLCYHVFVEAMKAFKIAGESDTLLRLVNSRSYLDCSFRKKVNESNTVIVDSSANIDKEILFALLKNRKDVATDHLLQGMMDNLGLSA